MKKKLLLTLAVVTVAGAMLMGCANDSANEATKEVVETEADADVVIEDEEAPLSDAVEEDADAEDADAEDADAEDETEVEAAEFETVEAFYTAEDNKAQLDASLEMMKEAVADTYADIEFNVTGNEIEYVYTLAEGVEIDAEQVESAFSEDAITALYESVEAECGVAPEKIAYTYKSFDGEVLVALEF